MKPRCGVRSSLSTLQKDVPLVSYGFKEGGSCLESIKKGVS
jgi:hypothetical protein